MKETTSKEIGSRIKELIFKLDLNQTSFAKAVGVSQNAIFKTVSGETQPRLVLIDAILKTYPQVNRDWLLEGKGEMFKETSESVPQNVAPDNYLQEQLRRLEEQFSKMREMFSTELTVKNQQIEYYQRQTEQLIVLLGKSECDTETGVYKHPATAELEEGMAQLA